MDSTGGTEGMRGWGEGARAQERRPPQRHHLGRVQSRGKELGCWKEKRALSRSLPRGRGAVLNVFPS